MQVQNSFMIEAQAPANFTDKIWSFAWQQPATNNGSRGFDSGTVFANKYRGWEQYAITGFALQFIPSNCVGMTIAGAMQNTPAGFIHYVHFFDDLNTRNVNAVNDSEILATDRNQLQDPKGTLRWFRDFRELSKVNGYKWQNTHEYVAGGDTTLSKGSTGVKIKWDHMVGNQLLGTLKATWFITFKGAKA